MSDNLVIAALLSRKSIRQYTDELPSDDLVSLVDGREETYTFEDYGWTEHISRKAGQ